MTDKISPIVEFHGFPVFVVTLLVFLFLWALRRLESNEQFHPSLSRKVRRVIPFADILGIVLIIYIIAQELFLGERVYWIVFLIGFIAFLVWVSRNLILDLIGGIVFRLENSLIRGDRIDSGEGVGTVITLGVRCLNIGLDKGKQVSIPYSQLSSTSLTKFSSTQFIKSANFNLEIPVTQRVVDIKSNLERDIMMLPWALAIQKPSILPMNEESQQLQFKITIYALELDHLVEIERAVMEIYKKGGDLTKINKEYCE